MEQFSMLTPGSVWARERKGKQIYSIVVCVTNTHLPAEKQEHYPPQVVYLDQRGRFNNLPADQFLQTRAYHDMHPAISYHMENLLEDPNEDQTTFEEPDLEGGVEEQNPAVDNEPAEEAHIEPSETAPISFILEDASKEAPIAPSVLSHHMASYQQRPVPEGHSVQHELIFELSSQMTAQDLRTAFSQNSENPFCAFVANGELVEWEMFLGVYPLHTAGSEYSMAVFRTNADYTITDSDHEEFVEVSNHSQVEAEVQVTEAPTEPAVETEAVSPVQEVPAAPVHQPVLSDQAQSIATSIVK